MRAIARRSSTAALLVSLGLAFIHADARNATAQYRPGFKKYDQQRRLVAAADERGELWTFTYDLGGLRHVWFGGHEVGLRDAHHVIQDAAVRDLPGYQTELAPGTQLPGPSNVPGTPHYEATQVQRQAGGGTYGAERRIAYKALRMAGFSDAGARAEIARADQYFQSIGVTPQTPTRIPGNRN